jgi:tetratricopeptide (TPR) repeat protein
MYDAIVTEAKRSSEKPQFVVFTGDLAFCGAESEYTLLKKRLLIPLRAALPGCPLFMVPGNHDVERGVGIPPRLWMPDGHQREKFQEISAEGQKMRADVLAPRFKAYRDLDLEFSAWGCDWLASEHGSACKILQFNGKRIAIVGINTAWLCQDQNDWGRLTAGRTMVEIALDQAKTEKADRIIVLGHHPLAAMTGDVEWSDGDRIRRRLEEAEAIYLHGHLHESGGQRSGDSMRSVFAIQAPSCFQAPDSNIWRNGLLWGAVDFDANQLLLWPQRWNYNFREYVFDADAIEPRFRMPNSDCYAFPLTCQVAPDPSTRSLLAPPLQDILTLPELASDLITKFVGREGLLTDFRLALRGLMARAGASVELAHESTVQMLWVHGFGGMGKSWFIRRACVEVTEAFGTTAKVGLVDWHSFAWHRPASTPPRTALEMFDAIAYRLAKLYGVEALNDYWRTKDDLHGLWALQREWRDKFDEALVFLQNNGPGWRDKYVRPETHGEALEFEIRLERTEQILEHYGVVDEAAPDFSKRLARLRRTMPRHEAPTDGLFERWLGLFSDDANVVQPTRRLADILVSTIRALARADYLILALDTCELLELHPLQDWLRYVFAQLIDGHSRLILLVGSRQRADVDATRRDSWSEAIEPKRFKQLDLDDVPFTRGDIATLLTNHGVSSPEISRLADHLFDLTLGVPLAVASIFDFYRQHEDGCERLEDLLDRPVPDRPHDLARDHMITEVAERFLLHLRDRPRERADIMKLALLLRADESILAKVWGGQPAVRLRELADRYTLLSNGDLHPTVRKYLREHWRAAAGEEVSAVATELLNAHGSVMSDDDSLSPSEEMLAERTNLLSWIKAEDAYGDIARAMAVSLAFGYDVEPLWTLLREIRPGRARNSALRSFALANEPWFSCSGIPTIIYQWLQRECVSGPPLERGCFEILQALKLNEEQDYSGATKSFHWAFAELGAKLPRERYLLNAYFRAVMGLGQENVEGAREAIEWCRKLGFSMGSQWNHDYYWVLHNSKYYDQVVAYCERVIREDPTELDAVACLAHVRGAHMNDLPGAEATLRKAVSDNAGDVNLHWFLADTLDRQNRSEEAEKEYLFVQKWVVSSKDVLAVSAALAHLYLKCGQPAKAAKTYRPLLGRTDISASDLNSIAWALYESNDGDLREARRLAARAVELSPDDLAAVQTYAAILIRIDAWHEALPLLRRFLAVASAERWREHWHEDKLMLQDAYRFGHAAELANLMQEAPAAPELDALRSALRTAAGTLTIDKIGEEQRVAVESVRQQIVEGVAGEFP